MTNCNPARAPLILWELAALTVGFTRWQVFRVPLVKTTHNMEIYLEIGSL